MTNVKDLQFAAHLTVSSIMNSSVISVNPEMSLKSVVELFLKEEISGAPVVDKVNRVLTVISEADLIKLGVLHSLDEKVQKIINHLPKIDELIVINKSESFRNLFEKFILNPVRRVVVMDDNGKLQGIVSRRDIMATILKSAEISKS